MQSFESGCFVCPDGHTLTWTKTYISSCGLCGVIQSGMSRFKCDPCNQHYCVKCMKPPVMGDFCGGGHPMQFVANLAHHSCDVCRNSIKGGGHRCVSCDYDICGDCKIDKED